MKSKKGLAIVAAIGLIAIIAGSVIGLLSNQETLQEETKKEKKKSFSFFSKKSMLQWRRIGVVL